MIDDAGKLHREAVELLRGIIDNTDNVTLLKKIIASGEGEISEDAFDRLVDIAFDGQGNGDALLEVITLCRKSGKMKERVRDRKSFMREKI